MDGIPFSPSVRLVSLPLWLSEIRVRIDIDLDIDEEGIDADRYKYVFPMFRRETLLKSDLLTLFAYSFSNGLFRESVSIIEFPGSS